jgi:hypothetical protein
VTSSAPERKRRPALVEDEDFDLVFENGTPQKNTRQLNGLADPAFRGAEGAPGGLGVSEASGASDALGEDSENERLQRAIARTAAQNAAIYKSKGTIKVLTGGDVPKQEPIARDFHRKNQKYIKRVNEQEEGVGGRKFRRKRPVPSAEFRPKKRNGALLVLDDETGLEVLGDREGTPDGSEEGRKKRRRKLVKVKREEGSDEDWRPESGDEGLSDVEGKGRI